MCLGAIYWSRADKLYFGNTRHDAAAIHFDDEFIYEELAKPIKERSLFTQQLLREEALQAFQKWEQNDQKINY